MERRCRQVTTTSARSCSVRSISAIIKKSAAHALLMPNKPRTSMTHAETCLCPAGERDAVARSHPRVSVTPVGCGSGSGSRRGIWSVGVTGGLCCRNVCHSCVCAQRGRGESRRLRGYRS